MLWEGLVGHWVEPSEIPAAACCCNVAGMAVQMRANVVFTECTRICGFFLGCLCDYVKIVWTLDKTNVVIYKHCSYVIGNTAFYVSKTYLSVLCRE